MTTGELIVALRKLGVQAIVDDGELKLRGPAGFLTPALKHAIAQHRMELRRLLQTSAPPHVAKPNSPNTWMELSPSQRQLWYEQQLRPDASHYNVPIALKLGPHANAKAAQQAMAWVVKRHAGLRAHFPVRADHPLMEVEPQASAFVLPIVDLPQDAADPLFHSAILDFIRRPFQLKEDTALRACLMRRGRQDSILVICLHHIVADGWSMGILLRDFEESYTSFSNGKPLDGSGEAAARTHCPPSQFHPSPELLATARKMLQGIPDLSLSCDFRRPETFSYRGGLCTAQLSSTDISELMAVARRCGTTLFSVFSACFMMLLFHDSTQRRFTVGTDLAGREGLALEEVVGHFVNQIVMIADLSGDPSLEEIINRAASAFLQAHTLREIPFDVLVKATREDRPADTPLFRAKIVMQPPMPNSLAKLPGIELLNIHDGSCKFDLLLNAWLTDDGAGLAIEYSRDLFSDATGQRFMQHLLRLLQIIRKKDLSLKFREIEQQLSQAEYAIARKPRSFRETQKQISTAR